MLRKVRQVLRRRLNFRKKSRMIVTAIVVYGFFLYTTKDKIYIAAFSRTNSTIKPENVTKAILKHTDKTLVTPLHSYSGRSSSNSVPLHGETNARATKEQCRTGTNYTRYSGNTITVRWNKDHTVMFCPIYKVGTTFWRRIYMIDGDRRYKTLINPFEIPFDKEYPSSKLIINPNTSIPAYTYMFSREPYTRVLSFYVDKLLAPNPFYWKVVGIKVGKLTKGRITSKCGHNVKFPEFIKYVIQTLKTRKDIDPHWVEMEHNCRPCDINYTFIGKMETFAEDSSDILLKLGFNKTVTFLKGDGKDASNNDAIKDTVAQPFAFKAKYKTCISFTEAVERAWLKLQFRGLIGRDKLQNVTDASLKSSNDLYSMALKSRTSTTKQIRTMLKLDSTRTFWAQIDISDLLELKRLYARDFALFGYDTEPEEVFQGRT